MVIVWPSGVAVAPAVWPTAPLPPVRFTTVTGCPSSFSSSTATMRAMRSVPPPAARGQMSWMGRLGYLACAAASEGGRPTTSARHTKATTDVWIHLALIRAPPRFAAVTAHRRRHAAGHPRRILPHNPAPRPRRGGTSARRVAAVHDEHAAGHERRRRGGQVHHGAHHLGRVLE